MRTVSADPGTVVKGTGLRATIMNNKWALSRVFLSFTGWLQKHKRSHDAAHVVLYAATVPDEQLEHGAYYVCVYLETLISWLFDLPFWQSPSSIQTVLVNHITSIQNPLKVGGAVSRT